MWLLCPECRDESAFEQPPCADGHGPDCPEWFCVSCGSAVFAGGWEINPQAIPAARNVPAKGQPRRPHAA